MEAVEQFGCPRIVQTDLGTENVVVRDIQTYLRCSDAGSRSGEQVQEQVLQINGLRVGGTCCAKKEWSTGYSGCVK